MRSTVAILAAAPHFLPVAEYVVERQNATGKLDQRQRPLRSRSRSPFHPFIGQPWRDRIAALCELLRYPRGRVPAHPLTEGGRPVLRATAHTEKLPASLISCHRARRSETKPKSVFPRRRRYGTSATRRDPQEWFGEEPVRHHVRLAGESRVRARHHLKQKRPRPRSERAPHVLRGKAR